MVSQKEKNKEIQADRYGPVLNSAEVEKNKDSQYSVGFAKIRALVNLDRLFMKYFER